MALGGALKSVFTRFTFDFDGAKLSAINRTTGKAVTNLGMAARQAAALKTQVGGFLGGLRSFVALAVGGAAVRSLTSGFAQGADQVAKFAKATGLATDTYQGLIHAGELSGITQEEINKSLMQLSKRARDASMGLKASKLAFEEIGVSVTDASGKLKNGDQIMLELADRFREMPDGSKKTALSMELMGRSGAKLNVLLNEGSAGIKRYIADAKKLGIVLSKESLKAAEKFNDQMLRAKSIFIGLRNQIATRIIPAIAAAAEGFVRLTRTGIGAKVMLIALTSVAAIATVVVGAIVTKFVIAQWGVFVGILKNAVLVIAQMNFAMLPVVFLAIAMAAAIAGLVAVIEDLVFFARGDRSLIGRLFGRDEGLLDSIHELEDTLEEVITNLSKAWQQVWGAIVKLAGAFGIKLTTVAALLKTIAKFVFKQFLRGLLAVAWVFSKIAWVISKIVQGIAWLVATLLDELLPVVERIRDAFMWLFDRIEELFGEISGVAKKVSEAVARFFSKAADKAIAAWMRFRKFLKETMSKAGAAVGFLKELVTGGGEPVISPGLVPSPSTAGPPPQGGGSNGPQASLSVGEINITGSGLDEDQLGRAIDRGLTNVFNREMRNLQPAGEGFA